MLGQTIAPNKVRLFQRPRIVIRRQPTNINLRGHDPLIAHEGDQRLSIAFVMPTFEFQVTGRERITRKDRPGHQDPNEVAMVNAWARWAEDFCLMMASATDMLDGGRYRITFNMATAVEQNYKLVIGPHEKPWDKDWRERVG